MRREGYEFAVSKAEVLYKTDERGKKLEPMELVIRRCSGRILRYSYPEAEPSKRRTAGHGHRPAAATRDWSSPSRARGLIGYRGDFMTDTKGNGIMNAAI